MSTPIRQAVALIVRDPSGRVLVSRRHKLSPFLGDFTAFIGGRIEPSDTALAKRLFGNRDPLGPQIAAALRELLEETQLLVTRDGLSSDQANAPLDEVYTRREAFPPPLSEFKPAGRWLTPEAFPIRFDAQFFVLDVSNIASPVPNPTELAEAAFLHPKDILKAHSQLEILLARPTLEQLKILDQYPGFPSVGPQFEPCTLREVLHLEPNSGIILFPLRTPTLPPATHTNCYLVGHEKIVIVDPATYEESERRKLTELLDELKSKGHELLSIVLSHHHADHIGSAQWLSNRYKLPIWAHPKTKALLPSQIEVTKLLQDGSIIHLGSDSRGIRFALDCLHTPGHAPGHLVLMDRRRGSSRMIVGDMVAALGSILIDPPEGHMATYIEQLRRLRAEPDGVIYPAHGPPLPSSHNKLDAYIAHRLTREDIIYQSLCQQTGPTDIDTLVRIAYKDTPQELWPLAARSCVAHLEKLIEDQRVLRYANRFGVSKS